MIYCKESSGVASMIGKSKIYKNNPTPTQYAFMNDAGTVEQTIYTCYVYGVLLPGTTRTTIPLPGSLFDGYRYTWIDLSKSFITTTYSCYPFGYADKDSYVTGFINKNTRNAVLNHSNNWDNWDVWLVVCCSA